MGALNLFSCPKGGSESLGTCSSNAQASAHGWRGRARPRGAHARAAGSLPFWTKARWASPCFQQRMVPHQPQVPSLPRECCFRGARSRMSTYCLAAGFSRAPQGGAVRRKPGPGVFSPPLTQTGEGTYCHLSITSQHHLPESSQQPARKEVIALLSF